PRHVGAIRCQHHADERKRQREERVRQLHEIHIDEPARSAVGERLTFTGSGIGLHCFSLPRPSAGHISSTRRFVSSSISITSGHSRVKPSSGSLRVASSPSLEPYVNDRLE